MKYIIYIPTLKGFVSMVDARGKIQVSHNPYTTRHYLVINDAHDFMYEMNLERIHPYEYYVLMLTK